ncbi:uncharacterized protein LOC119613231 isoform X2 [Lucilia sericata]|uniref:uncharacterized protein LOC119613231 isoform X2 n=1 Tax=Lucilia sericata TaxID=13632 RepID=UPI0018A85B57|nr:uncharacterized protein LOC119613231 isoform X2 [Lucilia sericata]
MRCCKICGKKVEAGVFLKDLVRLQVLLGLKAFIFCVLEWKNLNKISNGLIQICRETLKRQNSFDLSEAIVYLMFFSTLMVGLTFGLYIAIELKFELPPLDHIMIGMALFIPHFTLASCLRLYTLGLWCIKGEMFDISKMLKEQDIEIVAESKSAVVVVEIVNPVFNQNSGNTNMHGFYGKLSQRLDCIADFLKVFDGTLQRQLGVLLGLNFNCFLAGTYGHVYFENFWKVLFTDRNRRIFYVANAAIFVCILMDYAILLITSWSFNRAKQNLYNMIVGRIYGNKPFAVEIRTILKHIKRILSKDFKLKLFGLVEFNTWNFLILQGLMTTIIALIVSHQYLNDEIKALNERLDINDSDEI